MFVQCQIGRRSIFKDIDPNLRVEHLFNELKIDPHSFYALYNGRKVEVSCQLKHGQVYHFVPKVLGGKGGFGSMLRAIGAQIEKTTSREACRDLSGRRMRDVNNEKKLKDWLAKEADREREREERRQERLAAQLAGPKHKFDDPEYHKQRSKVHEDLNDALEKGLKRASGKNEPSSSHSMPTKKMKTSSNKEWLGMDLDSDDLESDSDNEAHPGSPNLKGIECEMSHTEKADDKTDTKFLENSKHNENRSSIKASNEISNIARDDKPDSGCKSNTCSAADLAAQVKSDVDNSNEPVDLGIVSDVDELESMGLERLKNALICRGLKCGGTLEERAQRLFSVKGLTPDQFPSSLIAKSKGGGKKSKPM